MKTFAAYALAAMSLVTVQFGCAECPKTLVSMEQVVGEYNANAAAVPKLWAQATIDLTIADDKGEVVSWGAGLGASNGLLLLGKNPANPAMPDFVLVGRESGRELFRLGASSAENLFYTWYQFGQHGQAQAWHPDKLGAPGSEEMFVDPLGLVSLLGIVELPMDTIKFPVVAMSMSRNPCAYVLTCIDRQPATGKIVFKREIYINWTDKGPRRPFQVVFFAPDGRRIMTAKLANYQPIPDTKVNGQPALMPTDITMVEEDWPGRKSHLRYLHLRLSGMSINRKIDDEEFNPAEAAEFESNLPPVLRDRVIMDGVLPVPKEDAK